MDKKQSEFQKIIKEAAARHKKLCPRIVLGARIGLAGVEALGIENSAASKQMLVIVETDGCFVSGVEAATGCLTNHRTLRINDYGKVAGTFVDILTGTAVRVSPRSGVRELALAYALEEERRYFGMLEGYQRMPTEELLRIEEVQLATPVKAIISQAGIRANCDYCDEEIINEREIIRNGLTMCKSCAEPSYYQQVHKDQFISDHKIQNEALTGVKK